MPELARLAARAREEGRLGIDTEFMPEGRYRPLLCLVQVCVGDEIIVLDPIEGDLGDPAPFAAVLADPAIEVVLHAGRQDVAILRRAWNTTFANVFDTQIAAGFAGFSAQAGYTGLLHDLLRIRLSKSASFTRWDARPRGSSPETRGRRRHASSGSRSSVASAIATHSSRAQSSRPRSRRRRWSSSVSASRCSTSSRA